MLRGHVVLGDRHEARQPRLRGEEIVVRAVERVGGLLEADGEQLPLAVEQEAEVHLHGEVAAPVGEGLEPGDEARGVGPGGGEPAQRLGRRSRRARRAARGGPPPGGGSRRSTRPRGASTSGASPAGRSAASALASGSRYRASAAAVTGSRAPARAPARAQRAGARGAATSPAAAQRAARPRASARRRARARSARPRSGRRRVARQACRSAMQMPGQVAAVHGRDVRRLEHAQVPQVVPVVEVAAEAPHPLERPEHELEPLAACRRA